MQDQYSGIKELYEVVLRAKTPMTFGSRRFEEDEPVLYFENIDIASINERSNPIMARGGWSNMPRVIWEDRSEVHFQMTKGVMSAISMSILFTASVLESNDEKIIVTKREGPFGLDENNRIFLQHWPVNYIDKKTFIYEYENDVPQKKVYGKRITGLINKLTGEERPCIEIYEDKELTKLADPLKSYFIDYGFEYKRKALFYLIQKERFNGLFSLEGKFYTKDENEGINTTNILYMPKVRVVSDFNLRLGEKVNPAIANFDIIGLPEKTSDSNNLIMRITRLSDDIDADI